jgi:CheY-like chemotaxis protein
VNEKSESRKFHILLVEDNDADVYLLRKALQQAGLGFELTIIDNGADALDFVRDPSKYSKIPTPDLPDLILLDLNLPRRDGFEVLSAIRGRPSLVGVPIGILTSSEAAKDRHRVTLLGAERYIHKPLTLEEFIDQVGSAVVELLLAKCKSHGHDSQTQTQKR